MICTFLIYGLELGSPVPALQMMSLSVSGDAVGKPMQVSEGMRRHGRDFQHEFKTRVDNNAEKFY